MEKYGRAKQAKTKMWHMRIACRVTTATDTHSECVILIVFRWQQWLRTYASLLSTYVRTLPIVLRLEDGLNNCESRN